MPVTTPLSQCQYCAGSGLSSPFSRLKAAMLDGVACVPEDGPGRAAGQQAAQPEHDDRHQQQHHQGLRAAPDQEPGHGAAARPGREPAAAHAASPADLLLITW